MKRVTRNPEIFEVFDLFKALARKEGYSLDDKNSHKEFLQKVTEGFNRIIGNACMVHGHRTQEMFSFVVASLGKSIILKQEDAGEFLSVNPDIIPPDYRIVLEKQDGFYPANWIPVEDHEEFFVEVKNFYQNDPTEPYIIKTDHFNKYHSYARIFNKELKFAIYWSKWNIWTLIPSDKFTSLNGRHIISMTEAFKINEMALLGDVTIGVMPPLSLKVFTEPTKSRLINKEGTYTCTIGEISLYCNDNLINNKLEKNIVFYLMLFGDWQTGEEEAQIEDNELISFEFIAKPKEITPGQGFEMIGSMSQMISKQYKWITAPNGEISKLSPCKEPNSLGIVIPNDYKGEVLKLWRFILKPNNE